MTETVAETNQSGWYPHPTQAGMERHWDGERWGEERAGRFSADGSESGPPAEPFTSYRDDSPPRPLTNLGLIAVFGLVVTICADVAVLFTTQRVIGYVGGLLDRDPPTLSELEGATDNWETLGWVSLCVGVITAVAFVAWFHRAYRNLPRNGISELRFSPDWAIGAWFIPIFNWVRPKQMLNDVWKGSVAIAAGRPQEWREHRRLPRPLDLWWACWAAAAIASIVGGILIDAAVEPAENSAGFASLDSALRQQRTGLYIEQAATLLAIVAALLAIRFILLISRLQDDHPYAPIPAPAPIAPAPNRSAHPPAGR